MNWSMTDTSSMHIRHVKAGLVILIWLTVIGGMSNVAYAAPPLQLRPNRIADGALNSSYLETLTGRNGTTPYFWSISAGSLPPGLTFTPSGSTATISGTPTQTGTFTFTVQLRASTPPGPPDNGPLTDSQTYTVTIALADCYFNGSSTGGISFNVMDPSMTPGPILGTVTQQINFICRNTLPYTVTANPASGWTLVSGANTIPYMLGFAASGTGTGAPVALLTNSTQVIQADYASALAGAYANSQPVTFTITWTGGGGGSIVASLPAGSVSGSLINTCATPVNGTITFNIDQSSAGPITAATTDAGNTAPTVRCTNGYTPGVACTSGHGYTLTIGNDGVTDPIAYTITGCPPGITGQGFAIGAITPVNFGLSLAQVNYQNANAGAHTDTITVTITY